jgi:hypothetical protein
VTRFSNALLPINTIDDDGAFFVTVVQSVHRPSIAVSRLEPRASGHSKFNFRRAWAFKHREILSGDN